MCILFHTEKKKAKKFKKKNIESLETPLSCLPGVLPSVYLLPPVYSFIHLFIHSRLQLFLLSQGLVQFMKRSMWWNQHQFGIFDHFLLLPEYN